MPSRTATAPAGGQSLVPFLQTWRPYLWLSLAVFLVYWRVIHFGFTYLDDNVLVLNNQNFLTNWSNLPAAFKQNVFHSIVDAYYRPMLTVSFMIDAQLGGINPPVFHLSNLLIHLAASCLFFVFLCEFGYGRALAFFAALIFSVHPVLTQAVAWIPGRNDSLLAVFVLAAFISLIRYEKDGKILFLYVHAGFFALAMFTKESAIAVVPMAILFFLLVRKEKIKVLMLPCILWAVVAAIWFLMRHAAFSRPLVIPPEKILDSIWSNSPAIMVYLGKLLFPVNLSVLPILRDSTVIYGLLGSVLVILALWLSKRKRYPLVFLGLAWFILFLLPAFIRPNADVTADFIEHRVYVPLIGFFIVMLEIDWIGSFTGSQRRRLAVTALIALVFSIVTFSHLKNFRDKFAFWHNAAEHSPHSPLAHRNLGAMYYLENKFDEATAEYLKAMALNPEEQMVHNNLGLIYMNAGRFTEAEREYLQEIALNPIYDDVYFNYGLLCYQLRRFKDAEVFWKKTLELNPGHPGAYHNLAALYYSQKRFEEARPFLRNIQAPGSDTGR